MSDEDWRVAAKRAGLDVALESFPDDVAAAAASAANAAAAIAWPEPGPAGAAIEPWPPMRMPGSRA